MIGLGFTAVLVVLGGMREILGAGTLFAGADRLFGDIATNWTITLFETDAPFLLAILPPGAFLGMGLLIAIKNIIDAKLAKKAEVTTVKAERVRVTAES
jgi:electron transport complex protein RnfE